MDDRTVPGTPGTPGTPGDGTAGDGTAGTGAATASSGQLDLEVLGVPLRVTTRWEQTRAALAEQWRRCLAAPDPRAEVVDAGDVREMADQAGYGLASTLTLRAIEAAIGTRLMFHAAGLATPDGAVVALIAASGTGKTTAALTLCREAFGYVTDETVSVGTGDEYDVLPYPKPLSVVRDPAQPYGKSQHGPDELGLRPTAGPLHLARVVLLERVPEADGASLAPVGLLDGIIAAAQQVSALSRLSDPLQLMCRVADRCRGFYRLTYADIATTTDLLVGLVDAPRPRTAEDWRPWPADSRPEHWTDAVLVGDEALVLVGTLPIRLGPVGRTALEVLLSGGDETTVLAETVDRYGPHPQAERLVAEAVVAITASDLLPRG